MRCWFGWTSIFGV